MSGSTGNRRSVSASFPRVSWHVQNGTPLQELMELGGWASYEMVLRYAHFAADHLRGAAGRNDGTFSPHKEKPHIVRFDVSA